MSSFVASGIFSLESLVASAKSERPSFFDFLLHLQPINRPSGCIEIYRALMAFAWIDFGLRFVPLSLYMNRRRKAHRFPLLLESSFSIIFIAFVCILADKHTNARSNINGWKIPIWGLCRLKTPADNSPEKVSSDPLSPTRFRRDPSSLETAPTFVLSLTHLYPDLTGLSRSRDSIVRLCFFELLYRRLAFFFLFSISALFRWSDSCSVGSHYFCSFLITL